MPKQRTPRTPTRAADAAPRPLRTLLVSDRRRDVGRVREALRATGCALTLEETAPPPRLMPRVLRAEPDLVLLVLGPGLGAGLETLQRLTTVAPQVPVVVVARPEDEAAAREAMRLGAQDYRLEDALEPRELARALGCAVERHRLLNELREQSWTDPLTGLYNRRGFAALAESHLRLARRNARRVLVICADLDDLKSINDRHGHDEGDRAIVRAAGLLRRALRESDVLARFGGDEFVALAHDADLRSLEAVRARIEARFQAENQSARRPYRLALSLGAASMDASGASLTELLTRADDALYRAKRRRRAEAARAAVEAERRPGGDPGLLVPVFIRSTRR